MNLTPPADDRAGWRCLVCRDLISLSDGEDVQKVTFEDIQRSYTTTACPYCKLWTQAISSYPEVAAGAGEVSVEPNLNQPLQIRILRRKPPGEATSKEIKWWNLEIYANDVKKPRTRELDLRTSFYIGHTFDHVLGCDTISGGQCLEQARKWLEECLAGHPNYGYAPPERRCSTSSSHSSLPTRVLCVEAGREPYLMESAGKTAPYVALSYCWGSENGVQTTSKTIDQHKQGIPLNDLPKTLRDAVVVTRYLGLNYLWIDALCIIQDSIEDWTDQSTMMGEIYQHATLVIAASDSPASTTGLFHKRKSSHKLHTTIPGDEIESTFYVRPRRERFYPEDQTSRTHVERMTRTSSWSESPFDGSTEWFDALGKRGWVYQEHHIPSRILHFTRNELGWSCGMLETCECTVPENPMRTSQILGSLKRLGARLTAKDWTADGNERVSSQWRGMVEDYTKLKLTKPTDRLPALGGIAAIISKGIGNPYLFGLWENGVRDGHLLCWSVPEATGSRNLPLGYAPTWSWASLYAPVVFAVFLDIEAHRFTFGYESFTSRLSTKDLYGPGTEILLLRGTLVPINVHDESGFYTDRGVDYDAVDEMATLFAAGETDDPNPAEFHFPVSQGIDTFGKTIDDLPDVLNGDISPDVFPLPDDDGKFHFFIVVETVEASMYGGTCLTRPHGLILHREGTGKKEKFSRVGWGVSCANMPTEWWKTCGWTQTVALV